MPLVEATRLCMGKLHLSGYKLLDLQRREALGFPCKIDGQKEYLEVEEDKASDIKVQHQAADECPEPCEDCGLTAKPGDFKLKFY